MRKLILPPPLSSRKEGTGTSEQELRERRGFIPYFFFKSLTTKNYHLGDLKLITYKHKFRVNITQTALIVKLVWSS